jgi:hypothetical protein
VPANPLKTTSISETALAVKENVTESLFTLTLAETCAKNTNKVIRIMDIVFIRKLF